jgi:hypothetical protein
MQQQQQQQQQQLNSPAAAAQEFMSRVPLKGVEVEAFVQVFNWLQAIVVGDTVVTPRAVEPEITPEDELDPIE